MSNLNSLKRNYILYATGQGISKLGSALTYYALSLEILKTTKDMRLFALALSLKFVPQIILYPVAGAFVDSIDKKKLMITIDLLRGVFLAISSVIITNVPPFKVTMMVIIIIILSLFEVLYNPATNALIPSLFKSTELVSINTTLSWINSSSTMISPLLGSLMYMKFGISHVIAIDSITYFIIVFLFIHLVIYDAVTSNQSRAGLSDEIKIGFELIARN